MVLAELPELVAKQLSPLDIDGDGVISVTEMLNFQARVAGGKFRDHTRCLPYLRKPQALGVKAKERSAFLTKLFVARFVASFHGRPL